MIRQLTESLGPETDRIDRFVSDHPLGNYFQSPHLYSLHLKTPNCVPVYLISCDESGEIDGVLLANLQSEGRSLKGRFSSRCVAVGGPLVKNNDSRLGKSLITTLLHEMDRKSVYVEFRQMFVEDSLDPMFTTHGLDRIEYYNFIMPVENLAEVRKRLHRNRRRQIDKSLKEGAKIQVACKTEEVREYYDILSFLYRTKVKKPLPPFQLFENFFLDNSTGKFFLVEYQGKVIGGAVCPIYKRTVYEWYLCGLDRDYKNLYPSAVATWAPIEYAANNGLKTFDFMGAGPSDKEYGVREFKERFGGELVRYNRFLKVNNRLLYQVGKAGLAMYSIFR